jgi:hypothetical protein
MRSGNALAHPATWTLLLHDPFGKKHYKLRTQHLKLLIQLVEQGGTLQSRDDVPDHIREQLFAGEEERLERLPTTSQLSHTISAH